MVSKKHTSKLIISALLVFLCGLSLGLLVDNIPFISFKNEVDLGTLIAVLSLVATIFIMPFIIEKRIAKRNNINQIILIDIDLIYGDVCSLQQIYVGLGSSTRITRNKYVEILALFKAISSGIIALNVQLDRRDLLKDFKRDVYDNAFTPAKESCTDQLLVNRSLSAETILLATESLNALRSALRNYRYEAFNE